MFRILWRRFLAERVSRSVSARLAPDLDSAIASALAARSKLMRAELLALVESKMATATPQKPWKANLHIPVIGMQAPISDQFMAHSTCCATDILHPEFVRLCAALGLTPTFHRKQWEWVFILHHAIRTGAVGPGRHALGFAVGTEPLPSAFAQLGTRVTATDAPSDLGVEAGWRQSGQFAAQLDDLHHPGIIDRSTFEDRVTFAPCDMTRIPADLNGYDFCWSSCSFEHLGSLKAGLDFVVESIETTLRPGGIACHTTEFNVASDTDTVETGPTVLYRKRDILSLIERLEGRGHVVEPFTIAPDTHVLDFFVDTPPYAAPPHLKLQLLGYVSTSVGLIIRRGR